MKKREQLLKKIETLRKKQEDLLQQEFELCKKYIQISDDQQWFNETERTVGRGKTKRTFKEGRFYWKESFKDEDSGKVVFIERSRPVSEDGEWDMAAVTSLVI